MMDTDIPGERAVRPKWEGTQADQHDAAPISSPLEAIVGALIGAKEAALVRRLRCRLGMHV